MGREAYTRDGELIQYREWVEFEDSALFQLRSAGKSFADISTQLGRSRASCIGRYDRFKRLGDPRANVAGKALARFQHTDASRDLSGDDLFCEALAETDSIAEAGRVIGCNAKQANRRMARIKRNMGMQAV